jgi:hypothetical protein
LIPRTYPESTRPSGAERILASMSARQARHGSDAAETLEALFAQRADLDERLRSVDAQEREAAAARAAASEALTRLERRAASGERVDAAERKRAEDALTRARAELAAPFGERRAAVQDVIREHDATLRAFVGQHLAELYDKLAQDAETAATGVNVAARALLDAIERRMHVEREVFSLIGLVRRPEPNAVARTRTESVSQAIGTLLLEGGERAPLLYDDPRPRAVQLPTPDEAAEREPEPTAA